MPGGPPSFHREMQVEIYSDVVCPWCYIGKRRFEEALSRFEGRDDVTVVFKPFQLDPNAPNVPTPVLDAYARKFGGPEEAARIMERVTSAAAPEGRSRRSRASGIRTGRARWYRRWCGWTSCARSIAP